MPSVPSIATPPSCTLPLTALRYAARMKGRFTQMTAIAQNYRTTALRRPLQQAAKHAQLALPPKQSCRLNLHRMENPWSRLARDEPCHDAPPSISPPSSHHRGTRQNQQPTSRASLSPACHRRISIWRGAREFCFGNPHRRNTDRCRFHTKNPQRRTVGSPYASFPAPILRCWSPPEQPPEQGRSRLRRVWRRWRRSCSNRCRHQHQ